VRTNKGLFVQRRDFEYANAVMVKLK